VPPDVHPIGQVIDGRYEILQCIGEGGMGVVYKARQTSIDRMVAIKMLSSHLARDRNWVKRFYNEAKACSRLHHPNTIRMFDFGQTSDGKLFMAMEFLDGQSLRQAIATGAPLDPTRVLKILVQCCASLSEAHNLGIIHRDIKADNIFLIDLPGSRDHVKVLDFGVAKLMMSEDFATQVGVVFGTPQYMSPEQGRGEPLTPRSDLYGLGILAYEMLTGRVPFSDGNPMTVIQLHLQAPVPPLPPQVPSVVQSVVMQALEKDPNRRFQTASSMMEACQAALTALSTGPFRVAQAPAVGTPGGFTPLPARPGVAPGPPPAYPPPRQGFAASMPTVLDRPSPLYDGGGPAAPPGRPGTAAASAKTVMVDSVHHQQLVGAAAAMAPYAGGAPQRTVMLQDTEGIVSLAGAGRAPDSGPVPMTDYRTPAPSASGASILFWLFCLVTGLAVGVGAYWLVLELGQ